MTEYVTNVDLYVLADSQEEAERITERLIGEVFESPEVMSLAAQRPPRVAE
jgi:hypothetical protein